MTQPTTNTDQITRYDVDILSIESGRLLHVAEVRISPTSDEVVLWTRVGIDRTDVILQFADGTTRDVVLIPRIPDGEPYDYVVTWPGDSRLVPPSVPTKA